MFHVYLWIVLAPLVGAVIAGLFGRAIGRSGAHWMTILAVAVSTVLSAVAYYDVVVAGNPGFDGVVYTWGVVGNLEIPVGFLVDELSVTMMVVVTFVSLMVHIYTVGYMREDPGYQRFFSYISLFTFAMLMLVMSNNFMQLFFGWEAVGVVSYLLIGFWFDRESAIRANLKAFLVNRVGDLGFLLGIACLFMYTGSLQYDAVFAAAPGLADTTMPGPWGAEWPVLAVACICLFIGAMGKSAQFPLHVWLPDSMEGPTPISALIHAATMVTAGIFMVARMSPLFEHSEIALSFVLVIGAITALFMGLLGLVQHDIKRVVAYSTLSQLGYMTVGLGASAYAASIFHLGTHAFFKALLFLAAGSVIIALHHEQDMRRMGGLRKYMPITWITSLIGTLALIGTPGFAGFFSKESIIEAVRHSDLPGAGFAWVCVLAGVFVTALYSFRMYFLVFHGTERMDEHAREHLHETPAVVTVPLVAAGHPVGGGGLDVRGTDALRRAFRRQHRRPRRARCPREDGGVVARGGGDGEARLRDRAVLARAGRIRARLVPVVPAAGHPGPHRGNLPHAAHRAFPQVLLRRAVRVGARGARPCRRGRALAGGGCAAHRRTHGQRQRARRGLALRRGPPGSDRTAVPLRVRDDRRPAAARVAVRDGAAVTAPVASNRGHASR